MGAKEITALMTILPDTDTVSHRAQSIMFICLVDSLLLIVLLLLKYRIESYCETQAGLNQIHDSLASTSQVYYPAWYLQQHNILF